MRSRLLIIGLFALLLTQSGCLNAPESFDQTKAHARLGKLSTLQQTLDLRFAFAPLTVNLSGEELPYPQETTAGRADPNLINSVATDGERSALQREIETVFQSAFGQESVVRLAIDPDNRQRSAEQRLAVDCQRSEQQKLPLLVNLELVENSLAIEGPDLLPSLGEWVAIWFFPVHWVVPNERFTVTRKLKLSIYDVRKPEEPLYEQTLKGSDSRVLNEFEHGLVLLNTYRWLFGIESKGERYTGGELLGVFNDIHPHADRVIQNQLSTLLTTEFFAKLSDVAVQRDLTSGDPKRARLHTLVIGQNGQDCQFAEADARAVEKQLQRSAPEMKRRGRLLLGPVTKDEILSEIRKMPTKSVDRVLIYFAGLGMQGEQNGSIDQAVLCAKQEPLWITELAQACSKLNAKNVMFLFDTSFGGAKYRGLKRGRRSAFETMQAASRDNYLKALLHPRGEWQVIAAAGPDAATGEYKSNGLFTGLLVKLLKSYPNLDWSRLTESLGPLLKERSQAHLGRGHAPFALPVSGRNPFKLTLRAKRSS